MFVQKLAVNFLPVILMHHIYISLLTYVMCVCIRVGISDIKVFDKRCRTFTQWKACQVLLYCTHAIIRLLLSLRQRYNNKVS